MAVKTKKTDGDVDELRAAIDNLDEVSARITRLMTTRNSGDVTVVETPPVSTTSVATDSDRP